MNHVAPAPALHIAGDVPPARPPNSPPSLASRPRAGAGPSLGSSTGPSPGTPAPTAGALRGPPGCARADRAGSAGGHRLSVAAASPPSDDACASDRGALRSGQGRRFLAPCVPPGLLCSLGHRRLLGPRRRDCCLGQRDFHADLGAVATQFSDSTEAGTSPGKTDVAMVGSRSSTVRKQRRWRIY
jgi:hypothetical protein